MDTNKYTRRFLETCFPYHEGKRKASMTFWKQEFVIFKSVVCNHAVYKIEKCEHLLTVITAQFVSHKSHQSYYKMPQVSLIIH